MVDLMSGRCTGEDALQVSVLSDGVAHGHVVKLGEELCLIHPELPCLQPALELHPEGGVHRAPAGLAGNTRGGIYVLYIRFKKERKKEKETHTHRRGVLRGTAFIQCHLPGPND